MAVQGSYPLNGRALQPTDTCTGVVTGQTADIPLEVLADFLQTGGLPTEPLHGVVLNEKGSFGVTDPGIVGEAFISGGPSADPSYGILGLAGGGTGQTTAAAALGALGGSLVISSIAALRSVTYSTNSEVFVTGYYVQGDGGGGPYYYDAADVASADNGGTIIVAADGGRWKLLYKTVVSVKQFGAKGDNVNDDAPPIQACITAVPDTWIPAGTYLFNSTNAAPIPVTDPINVLIQSKNNFSVRCSSEASFICSNTANLSCMFGFWKCQNFVFDGPALYGNRTGIPSTSETVGINLMSVVDFQIKNLHLVGNWGDSGTGFGGDWWVNGLIQNVQMDQVGQGFDVAFMQNVVFDNVNVTGFSIVSGGAGNIGFNTSYDVPLSTYNFTGVTFLGNNTNHLYFKNFRVSNMNAGALITTGSYLFFDSSCDFNNNQGSSAGSINGWGFLIDYSTTYPALSAGFPVNKVYFTGTKFENNGLLVNGGGVLISGANITNSDVISDIVFENCLVYNNGNSGIVTAGEGHLSKIIVQNTMFESGGSQANPIVGAVINGMNSNGLPNNARITNNFGFNPFGYFTPTLPSGTGAGNTVVNTYAFTINVMVLANVAAYTPQLVQPSGAGVINLGTVAAGSGPQLIQLPPGAGIYFNTAVPSGWVWQGD